MIVSAVIIIANSPLSTQYDHLPHAHFTIGIPGFSLNYSLNHRINDGLMVLFFFVFISRKGLCNEWGTMGGGVDFLIGPVFAFANAAIPIGLDNLVEIFNQSLSLGGMVGLLAGKTIGAYLCRAGLSYRAG